MSKYRFEIRTMVEEDKEDVAQLVAKCYSERESITKFIGESIEQCYRDCAKPVVDTISLCLSFVCIDHFGKNGDEIIGCHLCKNVEPEEIQISDKIDIAKAFEISSTEFKKIYFGLQKQTIEPNHVFGECNLVQEGGNIASLESEEMENCESQDIGKAWFILNNEFKRRFLELHKKEAGPFFVSHEVICVQQGFENKGIATKMINVALSNAKRLAYKYFLIMPTGNEMLHIVKTKLKMKKLFGVRYEGVEYNGIRYLKGITEPETYEAYEMNLLEFDDEVDVHLQFNS